MPLKDLSLAYEYRSDVSDVVGEFYLPCLSQSSEYWRAVGYFTSQGLALAAKGLAAFISGGGRMRLVASPWFEAEDSEAFLRGYRAREDVIEQALLRQFADDVLEGCTPLERHRQRIQRLMADLGQD